MGGKERWVRLSQVRCFYRSLTRVAQDVKIVPGNVCPQRLRRRRLGMSKISRRHFVEGTGAGIVAATVIAPKGAAQNAGSATDPGPNPVESLDPGAPHTKIKLTVNGVARDVEVEDHWTLVELLRDHLKLTGTKIGCDRGECGCCSVLVDGKNMYSCSQLAVWMDGRSIQTVEGLEQNGRLDPLQASFMEHDAPQCGFCTSGQLMSAK